LATWSKLVILGEEKGECILQCGLRVYRIMKAVEESISPIREDKLRAAAKILGYENSQQLFDDLSETSDPLLTRRLKMGRLLDSREDYQSPFVRDHQLEAVAQLIGIKKDQLKEVVLNNPNFSITNKPSPATKSKKMVHGNTDYSLTILTVYLRAAKIIVEEERNFADWEFAKQFLLK